MQQCLFLKKKKAVFLFWKGLNYGTTYCIVFTAGDLYNNHPSLTALAKQLSSLYSCRLRTSFPGR